jgi:two-component system OmpR family response regulator/two-component system response regulator QseB
VKFLWLGGGSHPSHPLRLIDVKNRKLHRLAKNDGEVPKIKITFISLRNIPDLPLFSGNIPSIGLASFFRNKTKKTLMRLLLVEDDALLGAGLRSSLGKAGFDVTWVKDGQSALSALPGGSYLAMVLDIGLPNISGLEVLHRLRSTGNNLPVLMLTARDTTHDKVTCLDDGADDFLVKTTDMEELIARLRALIRRSGRGGKYTAGDLTIDVEAHTVLHNDQPVTLSSREFDILRVLMEGAGRVLTRGQLEHSLYGGDRPLESNSIEVHIHNLRNKIGAKTLRTVRGIGYTIDKPN